MKSIDFDLTKEEKNKLDIFFPKVGKYYRAMCLYNGVIAPECPNNESNLCNTNYTEKPRHLYHRWDSKNAIKCLCG